MKFQIILACLCFLASVVNSQYGYGRGPYDREPYGRGPYGRDFGRDPRRFGGPGYGPRFFPPELDEAFPEDRPNRRGVDTTTVSGVDETTPTTRRGVDESTPTARRRGVDEPDAFRPGERVPEYLVPELGVPGFDRRRYDFYPRRYDPRFYPREYGFYPPGRDVADPNPGARRTTRGRGGTSTSSSTGTTAGTKEDAVTAAMTDAETATAAKLDARSLNSNTVVPSASLLDRKVVELLPNTRFGADGRNTFVAKE